MEDYKHTFVKQDFLGKGAFGKVFKVSFKKSTEGDRRMTYALKVIELDDYEVTLSYVQKEFDLMKDLDHEHILPLYDYFHCKNDCGRGIKSFAIQMEYCSKGNLKRHLKDRKKEGSFLSRQKLLNWMKDLASAVEYIHSEKIIHRDLKPNNILLYSEKVLRISDFGLAKVMDTHCHYTKTAAGIHHFEAPEVFDTHKKRYTNKVDIYSLGKVFICMATLEAIPRKKRMIRDQYGEEISKVITECIRLNPEERPKASSIKGRVKEIKKQFHYV